MSEITDNRKWSTIYPQGQLLTYYQPIVALESRAIVGYEALGRERVDGEVHSLGSFFANLEVPVQEHLRIDRQLREQAIAKLSGLAIPPMLFINLKPSWIYQSYKQAGELHTLRLLEQYRVDPRNVCIEITEDEFGESMGELTRIVKLYRAEGCQIAIDDIGRGFSNFDRIARIRPNFLKVDVHLLKNSAAHDGYLGVLRSFSHLAEQVGASLLLEGVETAQDLRRAIRAGARYVQGYLFSPAQADFQDKHAFTPLVETELSANRQILGKTLRLWEEVGQRLAGKVRESGIRELLEARSSNNADTTAEAEFADQAIRRLLPELEACCIRVYLCRTSGIQLSANHSRSEPEGWKTNLDYRFADWSWRPYFLPHLSHGTTETKISDMYADLDSRAWIRTVSIPINSELVLLTDVIDSFE
ncbi:EAL domain-containing protein [Cohnella sp. LGH]|uniref:EAL domain-containing protein n=1 Tax=Cohnella sp. LGH TaxID=1619153 RepID=UPI001ADD1D66|nr:EAL domain-containing protein [Cohnella sp. LGH]QTH43330.1 EAL domain-containing protein [Cohnella sp. LGH]